MGAQDGQQGQVGPGWYADPQRLHQYRYWDGTAWTADVYDAQPGVPSGPAQKSRRRSTAGVWIAILLVLSLCGCSVFGLIGLARKGLSWQTKTQDLIVAAPSDGSSVTTTFSVGVSTELAGVEQVTLSALSDRLDHYSIPLQPGYDYLIDGKPSTMDGFFQAAERKTPATRCVMTYSKRGIQSLNLIQSE